MAITIDWGTKIISIPQADLTFISGSLYELDVNSFRLTLKALEDDEEGAWAPRTHNHNTAITLSGVTYARTVEIINGYTVTFEDGNYSVSCIGANHNLADVKNVNSVSLIINNSAGLIDINKADIEYSAYEDRVTIDVANGSSGTTHPWGTGRQPVDNLTDALTIAVERGFKELHIHGDLTIGATDNIEGYHLTGRGSSFSTITFVSGCSTSDTLFSSLTLVGDMSGSAFIKDCTLSGITGLGCTTSSSTVHGCLVTGNLTLRSDNNKPINIINCAAGENTIVGFDINGTTGYISIIEFYCRMKLQNVTASVPIHVTGAGMELTAESSCTSGYLELHGDVNFINESTIPTIDDDTTTTRVDELWKLQGLDADNPMTVTPTSRTTGDVSQTISGDGVDTSTVTRT